MIKETRERERLKFKNKAELARAYGLVSGLLEGIKLVKDFNVEGLTEVLEEVRDIIEKYSKII
jgi:hypothetical protein